MMSPTMLVTSIGAARTMPYREALRCAVTGMRWRSIGAALLIAAAFEMWSLFDVSFNSPVQKSLALEDLICTVAVNLVVAFTTILAARVADARAAQGLKRVPAYALAVVLGAACGAITEWGMLQVLSSPGGLYSDLTRAVQVFVEYLIWGSIIVFLYVNRSNSARATAHMNAAQLRRTEVQRKTLEAKLQVLQARIEPQFLHNTLKQVCDLYESDPLKAAQLLGHLIVYLRAALPHFRLSTSTLAQELNLVSAYVRIKQSHAMQDLAFDIDVGPVEQSARLPPTMLLPLVDGLLRDRRPSLPGARALSIVARQAGTRLRIEIVDDAGGSPEVDAHVDMRNVAFRLHALYGEQGALTFARTDGDGTRLLIEIPYESADGSHR